MPKAASQIRIEAIASFRLRRHHLLHDASQHQDAVTICRDMCGVQAQIMSAARLQLWTRNHAITRAEIDDALWTTRTLVKTSLMRQTLHLVPTDEFALYISALRPSRFAQAMRVMDRCGITREESAALVPLIMETLSAGPIEPACDRRRHSSQSQQASALLDGELLEPGSPAGGGRTDLLWPGRGQRDRFHTYGPLAAEAET